jgi:hypothetical protein
LFSSSIVQKLPTKMMHLAPTASSLLTYCVLYPLIIRGLYLLRQSFEPLYMNATCLMDFVRLSSPEHWDVHPLWKYFYQSTNATCEDLTGVPIQDHFVHVYKSGTTEFYIFYGIVFLYTGISTYLFLRQLFTGKVKSFVAVIAMAVLSWNQGSLFHLLSHYQNDLYHLNGNVMHHSSFTVNGDNAALVNTLPPGLIINFLMNFVTVWMMFYVVLDYFKLDKWVYLNLSAPMMVGKLLLQMKIIHPYIHTQHKSWYGPFVAKYIMDEYKGHVLCHHVSGYCLGDAPTYTWFYDRLMYYHGLVYQNGWLTFGQPAHYAANMGMDYFLLITIFGFAFITVGLTYPFLQKAEKKEGKAKTA